jgi:orotate phosphoribosyltransferase
MNTEQKVARALIEIEAVIFAPENPVTFKSRIISPVYVDNRRFPYHPKEWKIVIEGFKDLIKENNLLVDVVAGVEAGGIPHSAALGFYLDLPSVFVRKEAKEHGKKKMVEGGEVKDKKVILIEDLVSTGLSSLAGVESLRREGAKVSDCLVIVSYDFLEAKEAFKKAKVVFHPLTTFPVILSVAEEMHKLTAVQVEKIKEWFRDPHGWGKKYGYEK